MSPWLFNVNMYGVVREVNVMELGKGLELLSANDGRFEINQLLFADDTALVADSEEKLGRLVSKFGRVCERRKLRVNVGKSKVIRCSRYGNGDRMHVILKSEPLSKWIVLSTWGRKWQLMEDVRGMWYTEWMRGIELGER